MVHVERVEKGQNGKKFTPEEKFRIVKEGVTKARSVSEISDEYGIHPNQFYKWQKDFFDGALEGFRGSSQGRSKAAESREEERKAKEIQRMREVITELASENINLKKNFTD